MNNPPIRRSRVRRSEPGEGGRQVSCLGCLGTIAATMALCTALVWALNPDMSVQDAAREGILLGGGLTAVLVGLGCVVPVLLLVVAILVATRRRRAREADAGPTIIDVDA